MQLVKSARDTLLRPLQIVSGIVERRHTMPILEGILMRKVGAKSKKSTLRSKARLNLVLEASSDGTDNGQQAQCDSGGGSSDGGDDDGGGDDDSDRRRHFPPNYSNPHLPPLSLPGRFRELEAPTPSPSRPIPYHSALLAASLLSLLYLGMILLFAYTGHDGLVPHMLAGFVGFTFLVRCFIKPK